MKNLIYLKRFQKVKIILINRYFEKLKAITKLDDNNLSVVLDVDIDYLLSKKYLHIETLIKKIDAILSLYTHGYQVFGDEEKFRTWLFTSIKALGGKRPFFILNNDIGYKEVINILGRIEYGVFS